MRALPVLACRSVGSQPALASGESSGSLTLPLFEFPVSSEFIRVGSKGAGACWRPTDRQREPIRVLTRIRRMASRRGKSARPAHYFEGAKMETNYGAKTFVLQRFLVHLRPVVADVPRAASARLSRVTSLTRGRSPSDGGSAASLTGDE